MAEKKKKGFLSRIKDSLKIKKRGLSGANKELRRKRGRNLKSNTKMASFREDTKANQKLQAESKDARKDYVTYTKVNKKNKAKLSDQHKVKDKNKDTKKSLDQELQQDLLKEKVVDFLALEQLKVKKH